jgi:hypothetical protein
LKTKSSLFILTALLAARLSQAQGSDTLKSPTLQKPLLAPNEAVELAENYLTQVKHIDKEKFRLSGVRFEYYSSVVTPPWVVVGWNIDFDCVPDKLDCGYHLAISNTRKPKVVMYPIR